MEYLGFQDFKILAWKTWNMIIDHGKPWKSDLCVNDIKFYYMVKILRVFWLVREQSRFPITPTGLLLLTYAELDVQSK